MKVLKSGLGSRLVDLYTLIGEVNPFHNINKIFFKVFFPFETKNIIQNRYDLFFIDVTKVQTFLINNVNFVNEAQITLKIFLITRFNIGNVFTPSQFTV